jgi:predicted ribosomally synthesized peptide with SipW-like signal peptide
MSDESPKLTRRRIVGGLGILGAGAAAGATGTFALFSDTETSPNNTFETGDLDLAINGSQSTTVDVSGLAPSDVGTEVLEISNTGSVAGELSATVKNASGSNALQDELQVKVGFDRDGDLTTTGDSKTAIQKDYVTNVDGTTGTTSQWLSGQGSANDTAYLFVEYEIDSDAGNDVQNKSASFDIDITLEQSSRLQVGPTGAYSSIQAAIDAANDGETVVVDSGTYEEELSIPKPITLQGTGNVTVDGSTFSSTGLSIGGDGAIVDNIILSNWSSKGISLNADGVYLNRVTTKNCNIGMDMSNASAVVGLLVEDSAFNNGGVGWYIANDANNAPNVSSTFDDVTVRNTSFNGNDRKGIYAEKLSNALFDNIEIRNSGTLDSSVVPNGMDINLKFGDYENITIRDSTFFDSGIQTTAAAGFQNGEFYGTLVVKARGTGSDSSYATPDDDNTAPTPATVDNVLVENNTFGFSASVASNTPTKAIQTGEPTLTTGLEEPTPGDDNDGDGDNDITITGNTYNNVNTNLNDLTQ